MKMTGRIIGFSKEGCDPKRNRHAFSASVCECGRVRLTSRVVGRDLSVVGEPQP